jgi:Arc/MetJ family transcription regulator
MTTSICVDDGLLEQVVRLAASANERDAVETALREYVVQHRRHPILGLVGQGLVDPKYDVRAVREGMGHGAG